MSKKYNVAIVGATGAVGNEIIRVLEERDFPVDELRLIASERSDGDFLEFRDESIMVQALNQGSFDGIDLVFFTAGAERSKDFCPIAATAGAICIDLSSAWRSDDDIPLVVPEVNGASIANFRNKGIIASPNAATTQLTIALKPIHDAVGLKRVVVSTYQAVSATGQKSIDALRLEVGELLNGRPVQPKIYPHQIAFNCLPQIDAFLEDGSTKEEEKIVEETRKVLGLPDLAISATAVRVPVFYGHSESVNVETNEKLTAAAAHTLLTVAPGCEVIDDPSQLSYPMPVDAAGQDAVLIGRIREDHSVANGLNLWTSADNLRKGAATNAVQIAEVLIAKHL
ncbi:MAG: aspartate-semialdehyde dehydrogenase [Deltaproteobacteria bacterium HGW-Deltaproteobacteria-4]|nr:MAG: aspartate-semialdehyde dehydrogenase [Deltaproteobacteria bacterium HGW-Deltaproteobacteria-4]